MPNRLLTINIRRYLAKQPRRKRPARISRYLRFRIAQSTNVASDNIKISKELNELLLKRYLKSMTPIKLNINIDKGKAMVTPFQEKPVKPAATEVKPTAATKTPELKPAATQKPPVQKTEPNKTNAKEVKT